MPSLLYNPVLLSVECSRQYIKALNALFCEEQCCQDIVVYCKVQNIAPRSGGVDPTSLPAQTHLIPSSLTKVTALLLVMMSLKFCPNLLTFHHYYCHCQRHHHYHVLNDHGFVGWLNKTRSENDMHAQLVKTCGIVH